MMNMDIYNKFRVVPAEAKKTIAAGKLKGFTDVNPMWRIKMLTEQFGPCGIGWDTEIADRWIEKGQDGKEAAFMEIKLYVKYGEEWSKPIVGVGGSMFVNVFKGSPETSDEAFKMAYTDAISIACKALGMAADVYFEKDRTKYGTLEDEPTELNKPNKEDKPKVEYATEEQRGKLIRYYANARDKLDKVLKKYGVTNMVQLKMSEAQEIIDKVEEAMKKAGVPIEE